MNLGPTMDTPRTDRERINSMFGRLGPDKVRKALKDKRFSPSDEPELRRLLFKAGLWAAAPRLAGGALMAIGTIATVVSCWKA